jgi:micrococcal nuclease
MTIRNLSISFLAVLFFSQLAFSQTFIRGTVTDVLDGRTLVVETEPEKTVKVRLRYLEVPEKEQQLFEVVKTHLKQLSVGKSVEVRDIRLVGSYFVGVVVTKTNDLNQQMLRDGAAWFDIAEHKSVNSDLVSLYQENETAARVEKRGVWGVAGLQPAWTFRNEREYGNSRNSTVAQMDQSDPAKKEIGLAESVIKSSTVNKNINLENFALYSFQSSKPVEPSVAGNSSGKTVSGNTRDGNLNDVFYAKYNSGVSSTNALEFSFQNGKSNQRMAMWFGYQYSMENSQKQIKSLALVVASEFIGTRFLKGKSVKLLLDQGKQVNLGQPKYFTYPKADVMVFENIDLQSLQNVLSSENITVVIGKYKKVLPSEYKASIDSFINAIQ